MSKRNFSLGRKISWAGKQALKRHYGGGHFGSVATQAKRWNIFCVFAQSCGVADMRDVHAALVEKFAASTAGMAVATRQNLVSAINVVMAEATRGQWITVSPARLVGHRHTLRATVPGSLDRGRHDAAIQTMNAVGMVRAGAVAELARNLGVRSREAVLANLDRWSAEARTYGKVNVQEGAKGGRNAPRWVSLTDAGKRALANAIVVRPAGSKNLLAPEESYKSALNGWIRAGRKIYGKAVRARGYHDARAAYACERYRELTGRVAPVIGGHRMANCHTDLTAREQLAYELGHGRVDVIGSYIGGCR